MVPHCNRLKQLRSSFNYFPIKSKVKQQLKTKQKRENNQQQQQQNTSFDKVYQLFFGDHRQH